MSPVNTKMGKLREHQVRHKQTTLILTDEKALDAAEAKHVLDVGYAALANAIEASDPRLQKYKVCSESVGKERFNADWIREFDKDPENFDLARFKREWRPTLAEWELDTHDKHTSWLAVHDGGGRIRGIVSLYNTLQISGQKNPGRKEYTTFMAPMFDGAVEGEEDGTLEAVVLHSLMTETLATEENEEMDVDIVEVRFPQGSAANRWYKGISWLVALEKIIEQKGGVELQYVTGKDGSEWLHLARRVKGTARA